MAGGFWWWFLVLCFGKACFEGGCNRMTHVLVRGTSLVMGGLYIGDGGVGAVGCAVLYKASILNRRRSVIKLTLTSETPATKMDSAGSKSVVSRDMQELGQGGEDISHQIQGHKANLSNPSTSPFHSDSTQRIV